MELPEARRREESTYDAPVLADRSVRVDFGDGSLHRIGGEAAQLGCRAPLIAGPHEDAAADVVAAELGPDMAGRLREVALHVPTDLAHEATYRATQLGAEVILAVGGGSATGLAKVIALRTGLPILAVPTTYAGSEMTPIWGLTDFPGLDLGPYAEVLGGLHHCAISMEPARWNEIVRRLDEAGVDYVIHSGASVYFRDPDGTRIELIADPLGEMYGNEVL